MVKEAKSPGGARILEQGDIYFMYRPRIQQEDAEGMKDVQRFFMALKPQGRKRYRLIVIGRKHAPEVESHEQAWGFVDMVREQPRDIEKELQEQTYGTKTRGERVLPAARLAGEGVYAIADVEGQMHLVYALELPHEPSDVQKDLRIAPEASFVLSIKNPEKGSPAAPGLSGEKQAEYPKHLQEGFRGRRFDREHPQLLDYEGTEIVLVGARTHPEEQYGLDLEPEREDPRTADILTDLQMAKSRHPTEPLLSGEWR